MKLQIKFLIVILIITTLISGCVPIEIPEEKIPEKIEEAVPVIQEEIPKAIILPIPKEAVKEIPGIPEERIQITNLTISIVYNNVPYDLNLKTAWGISCLIETDDKNILFDIGGDSPTLLDNMEKMGIDPDQIDIVVLSHIHGDHVGGLNGFLEKNNKVIVYIPSSFPDSFRNMITRAGAEFVDVDKATKISDGVYSTGELYGPPKEQSLIIDTEKGLVVISGCAHPGIANIVRTSKELMNKNVYLVTGGFHSPPISVVREFRELNVEKVAPSHCTGEPATHAFKEEYKEDFIEGGVGKIIRI